ncbi:MAG: hypothetical protein AB1546_06675, partial [bacterium]
FLPQSIPKLPRFNTVVKTFFKKNLEFLSKTHIFPQQLIMITANLLVLADFWGFYTIYMGIKKDTTIYCGII